MMPNTADMEETTGADMGGILVMEATMAETAMEVTMVVMEATMAETAMEVTMVVMEATMAETAMEVTMAVMEATMAAMEVTMAVMEATTAAMVDMAVAEGAATMDVVGRVTMERGVVDAALMLVKLLMLKPKPCLKTKLIKQHSYLNYGAHFQPTLINPP
jgi:hypothetical protein